jgi:hypothetical protein
VSATCPAGSRLVGGGHTTTGTATFSREQSSPSATTLGGSSTVRIDDGLAIGPTVTVFALCSP